MQRATTCTASRVACDEYATSFVTCPIKDLNELLSYRVSQTSNTTCRRRKKSCAVRNNQSNNLLVCHDMRGNYLSDRFNTGALFDENAFEIVNWKDIDIFCYFSHHFVTIPPKSWVETCRRHHSRVLGTFLTEWGAGLEICTEMFSSMETVHKAVSSLVNIAQERDLDGWLINLENDLPLVCVSNVLLFLQLLTSKMHEVCGEHSMVMWYDAVTKEGKLEWQDGLTEMNQIFFEASDAIFINYTWKERSLSHTRCLLANPSQCKDVYYGVDVFGRGCVGGGGYNCGQALRYLCSSWSHHVRSSSEELELTSSRDVSTNDILMETSDCYSYSAALFAPGWVLETQCATVLATNPPIAKYLQLRMEFLHKSTQFWKSVAQQQVSLRRAPPTLPTEQQILCRYWGTSFSSSSGRFVFAGGKPHCHWSTPDMDSANPVPPCYYDLNLQDMNWTIVHFSTDESVQADEEEVEEVEEEQVEEQDSWDCQRDIKEEKIQFCDDVGWEGTGSLQFFPIDSSSTTLSKLIIPLPQHEVLSFRVYPGHHIPTRRVVIRTTERICDLMGEGEENAPEMFKVEVDCWLFPVSSVTVDTTTNCGECKCDKAAIRVVFSFHDDGSHHHPGNKDITIQHSKDSSGNLSVSVTCHHHDLITRKSTSHDGWEECSYHVPSLEEDIVPSIVKHFNMDESCTSFQFVLKSVSLMFVGGRSSGTCAYLGSFCALLEECSVKDDTGTGDGYASSTDFNVNVANPTIRDVSMCRVTGRAGVTIGWDAVTTWSSKSDVTDWTDSWEGISIWTIADETIHNTVIQNLIEMGEINEIVMNQNEAFLFSIDMALLSQVMDDSWEVDEGAVSDMSNCLLGSTRENSFRVNLLPTHLREYLWKNRVVVSGGEPQPQPIEARPTMHMKTCLLFLQPYSFAHMRPALHKCPAMLLCLPPLE